MHHRPYRTALYIPGSNLRALEKAHSLAADVILFDLEDAVAPSAKSEARTALAAALAKENSYAPVSYTHLTLPTIYSV